jgi:GNAT superfamily N-acetyltransferase
VSSPGPLRPRLAASADAVDVTDAARLLHDFNTEFDTPTPGPDVLARRLQALLSGDRTYCVLAGRPAVGIALVTLRPNVWFDAPVALLDELYVTPEHRGSGIGAEVIAEVRAEARRRGIELIEINVDEPDVDARRFYERHRFTCVDPDTGERALYYHGPARD